MNKNIFVLRFIFLTVILSFWGNFAFGVQTEIQQGLDPDESCVIEIHEPCIINQIKFMAAGKFAQIYDTLLLEIFWDGNKKPDIATPLSDLFCIGFGQPRHFSIDYLSCKNLYDETQGVLAFDFKMPCQSTRIRITNRAPQRLNTIYATVDYSPSKVPPKERFHIWYKRRCSTREGSITSLGPFPKGAQLCFSIQHLPKGPKCSIKQPFLYSVYEDKGTSIPISPNHTFMDNLPNRLTVVYQTYTKKTAINPGGIIKTHFSNPKGYKDIDDYSIILAWISNTCIPSPPVPDIDWNACSINSRWQIPSTSQIVRKILNEKDIKVKPPLWKLSNQLFELSNISYKIKDVKSSGYNNPYQTAKWAFDARLDTKWCVSYKKNPSPWIMADLGEIHTIKGFVIFGAGTDCQSTRYNIQKYQIQISSSLNQNWETIIESDLTPDEAYRQDYYLHLLKETQNARYIKLIIKSPCELDEFIRIQEVAILSDIKEE